MTRVTKHLSPPKGPTMIHAFPTRTIRADSIESGHQIVGEAGGLMLVIDVYRALGRTHLDTEFEPIDVADDHPFTITVKNVRAVVYDADTTADTVFDVVAESGYLDSHVGLGKLVAENRDTILAAARHNFTPILLRDELIRKSLDSAVRTTVIAAIDEFCAQAVLGLVFEVDDDEEGLIQVRRTSVPTEYLVEGPRGIATITSDSQSADVLGDLGVNSYHAVFVD